QPRAELVRQLARLEPPRPVAAGGAGPVHPRLAAEAEDVLRGHDREAAARRERELDQAPGRIGGIEARRAPLVARQRAPPAERRVGVVGAGVDDAVLLVVLRAVR